LVTFPAGQQLFYPGSRCENYLLVLAGVVKVQIMSESGREILLYHVHSGDSCVLTTSCMLSGDCYPAEGITEDEVTAFAMSSHAFNRCIEQSSFFREFVFKNFEGYGWVNLKRGTVEIIDREALIRLCNKRE
jgi:CRP/FNR family transcriptional regulator